MPYKILMLNPRLYYIKWFEIPKPNSTLMKNYFFELNAILDSEEQPVYFLSDLRQGHITNIHLLLQLAKVLNHVNFGGCYYFSDKVAASRDIKMFRYIQSTNAGGNGSKHVLFSTPEEAINHLESAEIGITKQIAWDDILSGAIFSR